MYKLLSRKKSSVTLKMKLYYFTKITFYFKFDYLFFVPVADISDNTKKCCSACFTRLTRKIAQLTDGSPPVSIKTESVEPVNSVSWSEEEIEMLRSCLKASGRNWAVISQKLNGAKTTEQCKKFFYNNRKKHQLDKLVTEFKRVSFLRLYYY